MVYTKASLDKTKEKLATKLYESIQASKSVDFITFMSALGIQGGAYNKCEKVVTAGYDTPDAVLELEVEKLMEVESFAEKSATEFINSIQAKKSLIEGLLSVGYALAV